MALPAIKTSDIPPDSDRAVKKRRFERRLLVLAGLVIIGLTILQAQVIRMSADIPKTHSILILILINLNIILLIVLALLVLRNFYRIFFGQREVAGAQLWTKLVVAFVSLSSVPTVLLFYASFQLIRTSHDYWFDPRVEQSLSDARVLGEYLGDITERFTYDFGDNILQGILRDEMYRPDRRNMLEHFFQEKRREYQLTLIEFLDPDKKNLLSVYAQNYNPALSPPIPLSVFNDVHMENRPRSFVGQSGDRDLIRVLFPIVPENGPPAGYMVVGYKTSAPIKAMILSAEQGLTQYRELKRVHDPIRVSHYIGLAIVALLSVFVSTWIGFHLAEGITGPIRELAEGTDRISKGDYDFSIDVVPNEAEIRTLVASFNRMTGDLKSNKFEIEKKNRELQESNQELDQRRRYIEFILQSVAAGVISLDADGIITTINRSAEEILGLKTGRFLGLSLWEIMLPEQKTIINGLIRSAESSPKGSAEKQVKLRLGQRVISLQTYLNKLKDDDGRELGMVIVFNDLSEVEKAQRMTAWREVARRIAHEIKNPLTPIQLSTQRLIRRYGERLENEDGLFEECTQMILRQVDELKRLTGEFSNFARMPQVALSPDDLGRIVEETLAVYREGHKSIDFVFDKDDNLPVFNLDSRQMSRMMINLLDNAVAAVDHDGSIKVGLTYVRPLKMARLAVVDNGIGISPEDKSRLFEPYFSTKKSGTGLGLCIVQSIVSDHDGFVRVRDNDPQGTQVIVELPVRT